MRSDRDPVPDVRFAPQFLTSTRRATGRERIIDEHDAVGDEAILANCNQFANEGVGLNPAARTDSDTPLNLDEWTDEHVVADHATIKVDRFDNCHI